MSKLIIDEDLPNNYIKFNSKVEDDNNSNNDNGNSDDDNIEFSPIRRQNTIILRLLLLETLIGLIGLASSFLTITVATIFGISYLSFQNALLLFILSTMAIIFLFVRLLNSFFNSSKKEILICLILLVSNIILFVIRILEFIEIPF
jgi:magnesium-transporting ATPase (P-type)